MKTLKNKKINSVGNKKTIGMFGILTGVLILVIGSVLAFGVSSQYWKDYPLQISPGETKDIYVVLQNRAGATEDIIATGTITKGSDIAKLTGFKKEYVVPFGGEIKVNIRVSIPQEIEIGHNYDIIIDFDFSSPTESQGPLAIGSSVEKIIPVLVITEPVEPAEAEKSNLWMYVIGIIALAILVAITTKIIKIKKSK